MKGRAWGMKTSEAETILLQGQIMRLDWAKALGWRSSSRQIRKIQDVDGKNREEWTVIWRMDVAFIKMCRRNSYGEKKINLVLNKWNLSSLWDTQKELYNEELRESVWAQESGQC